MEDIVKIKITLEKIFFQLRSEYQRGQYDIAKETYKQVRANIFEFSTNFEEHKIPVGKEFDNIFFMAGVAACYRGMIAYTERDENWIYLMHTRCISYLKKISQDSYNADCSWYLLRSYLELADILVDNGRFDEARRYLLNYDEEVEILSLKDSDYKNKKAMKIMNDKRNDMALFMKNRGIDV